MEQAMIDKQSNGAQNIKKQNSNRVKNGKTRKIAGKSTGRTNCMVVCSHSPLSCFF